MKKIILFCSIMLSMDIMALPVNFVHPIDFDGSDIKTKEVMEFIEVKVRADYCNSVVNVCDPDTLNMMQEHSFDSFEKLINTTDKEILAQVVDYYCSSYSDTFCDYNTIYIMYAKELEAKMNILRNE